MAPPLPSPEFSRPIPAAPLPPDGRTVAVDATDEERTRLAARFGLERLDRFGGAVTLRPLGAKRGVVRVEVTGQVEVEAVQTCGVTLAPLPCRVCEPVRVRFSSQSDSDTGGDLDIDPNADDDPPDPIVDGMIDVGEAMAEAFGLALDPHPRAPGVRFDAAAFTDAPAEAESEAKTDDGAAAASPFAALAALKGGRNDRS